MIIPVFYKAIMSRVIVKVPEIAFFEMYNGQPDQEEDEVPYNKPAVFIEFEPMQWQTVGNKVQECDCSFRLHIETETLSETSNLESDKERNAGLEHLMIAERVFGAIQGFSGDGFGAISRTGFIPDNNHDNRLVTILPFKTRLVDDFARKETIETSAELDLTREILP